MANRNPTNAELRAAALLALQEIADEERAERKARRRAKIRTP
jgi:hypothetical protein